MITKPYYLRGNTVRLTGKFQDWEDREVIPALVKLIIYNSIWEIVDNISVSTENRTADGSFYYDYIFEQTGTFYYEWNGEIDGTPSLLRKNIVIKQI